MYVIISTYTKRVEFLKFLQYIEIFLYNNPTRVKGKAFKYTTLHQCLDSFLTDIYCSMTNIPFF